MTLLATPLLNQAIAIVQRYQATAIAAVNPLLPTIYEFHKGPKWRSQFPWMTFAYEGTSYSQRSSQLNRSEAMEMTVTLESGQYDSELAQDQAIQYLLVLDQIFTVYAGPSPFLADWETVLPIAHETVPSGFTTPWTQGTVKEVFVEQEEQSLVLREEMDTPIIQVSLKIMLDLEEL